MLAVTLPVSEQTPHVRQRVELDGVEFVLDTAWNARASAWTMTIADTDEQPIRAGVFLRRGHRLLRGIADSRRPPGDLLVLGRTEQLGIDAFASGDASLFYVTAAELSALGVS
jgi:hypothetical protein